MAHGQCTTSATLPAPGSNLACFSGTTGGNSTSANAPTLGPSATGFDYCAAYTIRCTTSDQSAACAGQPSGTMYRVWVPLSASTAQQMLTMPSVYMQPFMCSTSGCNTVAASASCTGGGSPTVTPSPNPVAASASAAGSTGRCTTSATLPAAGSNLACFSGTTGGNSTSANAPKLGPSATGADYCAAYTIRCSPSDQSTACVGQPSGTMYRVWVPLGATTAQDMLTMPSVYMQPFMCSTSGCNTVAAATCSDGKGSGATSSSVAWLALAVAALAFVMIM